MNRLLLLAIIAMISALALCRGPFPDEATAKRASLDAQLIEAVESKDVDQAERLILAGADPNVFRHAVYCGDTIWKEELCLLTIAANNSDAAMILMLLYYGAEIDKCPQPSGFFLNIAAKLGAVGLAELFIEAGVDINYQSRLRSDTPLHLAALEGKINVIRILVESGARVNVKNRWGWTPLMNAKLNDHDQSIICLKELGAEFDDEQFAKVELFRAAMQCDSSRIMALTNDFDVCDQRDANGTSLPMIAIKNNCHELVEALIQAGCDFDRLADFGDEMSGLLMCALASDLQMARLLVRSGVNLEARSSEGDTALMIAIFEGKGDVADFLIKLGADVTAMESSGRTPLMFAAIQGLEPIAKLCLEKGADIRVRDCLGKNAFDYAVTNSHLSLASYLARHMQKENK